MGRGRTFESIWYTQAFLRELVLIYPTAAIMMQERGVSAVGLAALFMIWSGAAVVFEVPTGVLADRLPRRNVLVVSGIVKGFAFVVWWLSPTFWGFAAGFVLWGLGSALRSGASEAFLHDALTGQGRADAFERVYGREQAAGTCGVALALLLGGWLAETGYRLPLMLSVLAPWAAALLIGLLLAEPAVTERRSERFLETFNAGVAELRRRAGIMPVVVMIALLPTVYEVVEEFVPPLLDEIGYSLSGVGLVYGAAFVVRALSVALAHRLRSVGTAGLCTLFGAGGVLLGVGALAGGSVASVALCGYFALSGIGSVLLQGRLQAVIRGRARATITSVVGLLQELVSLGLYLAIGVVAEWLNWRAAVAGAGLWLLIAAGASLGRELSATRSPERDAGGV